MGHFSLEPIPPWVTAGLCQLVAPQEGLGEVNPSLQPETREANAALGLGQHRGAQFPLPVGFASIIPGLKHNRGTQKVAANSEGPGGRTANAPGRTRERAETSRVGTAVMLAEFGAGITCPRPGSP